MQFIMKKPIFAFFIELKKQLQLFQSLYWGRVRRLRFLRFGFAHGSSGSRFLRFIGCLIFCGWVPRFRFGSRTLLFTQCYTMFTSCDVSIDLRMQYVCGRSEGTYFEPLIDENRTHPGNWTERKEAGQPSWG